MKQTFWQRFKVASGLAYRAESPAPRIPQRSAAGYGSVTGDQAMSLSAVYRAMQILATSGAQLGITNERNGVALAAEHVAPIVRRPSLSMSRSDFVEQTIMSLGLQGNAYWRLVTAGSKHGPVLDIEIWNPHEVGVSKHPDTGEITYHYRGKQHAAHEVKHMHLLKLPGQLTGLGPIQAAQVELRGALELRDYASLWFSESKIPNAILKTEQAIDNATINQVKDIWNGTDDDPVKNPSGVRVLGKGFDYKPMMLSPSDAQWLESQQFTTTQIARLFGTPASLMLAAVEGSAQTYSNVEQDWIAFVRFTLMGYLRKIEEALGELIPRGQSVRFNIETLLRTDTKTRYEGHTLALGRWMDYDEVRAIEGLPPATAKQRELFETSKTAPPAPAPNDAGGAPETEPAEL